MFYIILFFFSEYFRFDPVHANEYVFAILHLQDTYLLFGSLGLFITLAVIMHFSKRTQW